MYRWIVIVIGSLFVTLIMPAASPISDPLTVTFAENPFDIGFANEADWDCLDDEVEHELAERFKPLFVFDSRENARRSDEPLTLYQVHTGLTHPHCEKTPKTVEIRYAYLLADDGGYTESFFCNDRHAGDNQSIDVTLSVSADGKTFYLRSINIGIYNWPNDPIKLYRGSHPVAFLSSGKHHHFINTKYNGRGSPYSNWNCKEGVDGRGTRVFARIESPKLPVSRHNVGERKAHSRDYFVNKLDDYGFKGENAWSNKQFCGGHQSCSNTGPMSTMWR
jgi:hypothetical protein